MGTKIKTVQSKIACKPYQGTRKIDAKISKGFATVSQKSKLVPLEVLVDFIEGDVVLPKGSKVHLLEEVLYNKQSIHKKNGIQVINGEFILIDYHDVLMVEQNA